MRSPLAPILTVLILVGSVLAIAVDRPIRLRQLSEATNSSTESTTPTSSSETSTHTEGPTSPSKSSSTIPFTPSSTSSSTSASTSTSTTLNVGGASTFTPPPESTTSTSIALPPSTSEVTSTSSSIPAVIVSSSSSSIPVSVATPSTTLAILTSSPASSTASNTMDFTVTAIVANPSETGFSPSTANQNSFFSNTGAVAGTFLVAGLFGTSLFICAFFWGRRKYRNYRARHIEDDEYWQFNRAAGPTTPEPTLPVMRETSGSTPLPNNPSFSIIERNQGDESPITPYYDATQVPFQADPGEFNPYHPRDVAYAFSTSDVYMHDATVPAAAPYGYQPSQEGRTTPEFQNAVAGPSQRRPSSSQSFHHDDGNAQTGIAM